MLKTKHMILSVGDVKAADKESVIRDLA